ncbi:MAG: four helix bundle protein [Patescibacteria group bacterium]|nr:four helix bundle protein [Patescibacteria group bacterium]
MENGNPKKYDLEDRTLKFAKNVRVFVSNLPKTVSNFEDGKRLVRSSGSVGANYIEANEALGQKDFLMRIKISRKEAKESRYWLKLISVVDNTLDQIRLGLLQESTELMMIFSAIMRKQK